MRGTAKYRIIVTLVVSAAGLIAGAGPALASGVGGDWTQADHDASGNRANTTATQITAANAATVTDLRAFGAPTFPRISPASAPRAGPARSSSASGPTRSSRAPGRTRPDDRRPAVAARRRPRRSVRSTVYAVIGGRVFVGQLTASRRATRRHRPASTPPPARRCGHVESDGRVGAPADQRQRASWCSPPARPAGNG